ncbi:IS1634 family transposase [Verrucomicrobium sp. 3C]|uniref:IS1634 family transposase n=1 Tax=Verrucomicrobium sp. 3C TaxID=1134055 RepID=UPI001E59C192|nr:IS1634 family transposase [Verrucomicrobium sp. 3C]
MPPELQSAIIAAVEGKEMVALPDLEVSAVLNYGGLAVLREAWERFGLERLFASIPEERQRKLLLAMIFGRILFPSSKLALREKAVGSLLARSCGLEQDEAFDEEDLYGAMDALDGRWSGIERWLYREAFPGGVSLVLYDLTSVYFEGDGPKGLARYGYSRDHRQDRQQVLLAVATDLEGIPLHVEVLRGNRSDSTTLTGLLVNLRRRLRIREATFVFDGGMKSRWNLEMLTGLELQYVTRANQSKLRELVKLLPRDSQPELWDKTRLLEIEQDGVGYVIAGGEERAFRDANRRKRRVARGEEELKALAESLPKGIDPVQLGSRVGRRLERLKAHKYFLYGIDGTGRFFWKRNEEAIRQEASLDGWYLLETNLPVQKAAPETVLRHYKGLAAVESAFSDLKSSLEVRPVYHWRPDRVRNHVRICFLAYWLTAKLSQEWKKLGVTEDVRRILQQLQSIRVGTLYAAGKDLGKRLAHIPKPLESWIDRLGIRSLFRNPPAWATA